MRKSKAFYEGTHGGLSQWVRRIFAITSHSSLPISHFLFVTSCFLLLTSLLLLSSCGYTIQTRAQLPFQSIAIGTIENKTYEPKLQDRLNRVLAETLSEYGFQISPSARYRLDGEVRYFELRPATEANLVATTYEIVMTTDFRLYDTEQKRSVSLMGVNSPFLTSFGSSGRLESVMAQKEVSTTNALRDLARALVTNIVYNMPKQFSSLLFQPADLVDAGLLITRFQKPVDPLSLYIRNQMSPGMRKSIDAHVAIDIPSPALKNLLVEHLNTLIQGGPLYDETRFSGIPLSEETRALVQKNPKGIELIRLNRQLLEEAYPEALRRLQDNAVKR